MPSVMDAKDGGTDDYGFVTENLGYTTISTKPSRMPAGPAWRMLSDYTKVRFNYANHCHTNQTTRSQMLQQRREFRWRVRVCSHRNHTSLLQAGALIASRSVTAFRQEDVSLVEMYYWNYDALYFGRHGDSDLGDNAATDIEECAPKLAELLDTTIDEWDNDDGQADLTADLFVPESLQCRVECTQMVIGHDGYVHMFCYPKHTSVQITTNYLSKKQLQEYLEAFNAKVPRHTHCRCLCFDGGHY